MKTLEELGISHAPWTQGGDCETGKCLFDDEVCDDVIYDANGQMVADISTIIDSDARLMAAAPDLYAVLLEIYEGSKPMCDMECHRCKHKYGCNKWVAKARAALEKAGGAEVEL